MYTAMFFHFMTAMFALALPEITYEKYKSQRPSSMEYTGRSMQKEAAAGVKEEKAAALQLLHKRPGSN